MNRIDTLRHSSRKLLRELGILELNKNLALPSAQHCHALVEIGQSPGITISELATRLILSLSAASRLVQNMIERGFVHSCDGVDRREKILSLSAQGIIELKKIDDFSNAKVRGAFQHLSEPEQEQIINAIQMYGQALESSRRLISGTKILTLSTSRFLRKQITAMVEQIQVHEFQIPITPEINACILKAEKYFYFNNRYNFWYATDSTGTVIGCIGLRRLDAQNGEVKKMFVDKRFRGRGIAEKLMDTLIHSASKHGFDRVWLGTVDTLERAKNFYAKCRFTPVEEAMLPGGFEKCHLDTVFFVREL